MTPLIRIISTMIVPVAFTIAITHLLGAEHGPGDGFTAGIIFALALTLQYETLGSRHMPRWLANMSFDRVLLLGLAVVVLSALAPLVVGRNLLAPAELGAELPLLSALKLTRATLFDTGVALVVFGGAMTAINHLKTAHEHRERQQSEEEA